MRRQRLLVFIILLLVTLVISISTVVGLQNVVGGIFWRLLELRLNLTFALGVIIGAIFGFFVGVIYTIKTKK